MFEPITQFNHIESWASWDFVESIQGMWYQNINKSGLATRQGEVPVWGAIAYDFFHPRGSTAHWQRWSSSQASFPSTTLCTSYSCMGDCGLPTECPMIHRKSVHFVSLKRSPMSTSSFRCTVTQQLWVGQGAGMIWHTIGDLFSDTLVSCLSEGATWQGMVITSTLLGNLMYDISFVANSKSILFWG